MFYRLHAWLTRFAKSLCDHPEGTICPHRQYEYDQWLRGYGAGVTAGKDNIESKWRGSLGEEGPYKDYPVPTPRPA